MSGQLTHPDRAAFEHGDQKRQLSQGKFTREFSVAIAFVNRREQFEQGALQTFGELGYLGRRR